MGNALIDRGKYYDASVAYKEALEICTTMSAQDPLQYTFSLFQIFSRLFLAGYRLISALSFLVQSSIVSGSEARRVRYSSKRSLIRSYEREPSGHNMEKVAMDVVILATT